MPTLFISDLHLDAERPVCTDAFVRLLRGPARQADRLFILGDLFEAWVGDDDDSALASTVAQELRALSDTGVPIAFMHGNRDFLLGHPYAARCGMRLLPDPCVVDLHGEPTLLMHGDLLCTDDVGYQQFRTQVRDPQWQANFLAQPLPARRAFAAQARAASAAHQAGIGETITDVAADTVTRLMARFGVRQLIHGHTHRPAEHAVPIAERVGRRIVLADWYGDQGEALWLSTGAAAPERHRL